MNRENTKIKGFTLIELLVVISIIAVLMSILMPALGKVRENAKKTICSTRQKDLGMALQLYRQSYDSKLPPSYAIGKEKSLHSDGYYRWHMRVKDFYDQQQGDSYAYDGFRCPNMEKYMKQYDGETAIGLYGFNYFFLGRPNYADTDWWKRFDAIQQPSNLPIISDLSSDKVGNLFPNTNSGWWMSYENPHPSAYEYGWLGGDMAQYGESRSNMYGPAPNHGSSKCNFLMADGHTDSIDVCKAGQWPWLGDSPDQQMSGKAFHPLRNPASH
ncbi:MAG: DUF1559 domain-containing protein [Sedimentisphaeraceae bacterium JB056]